MRIRSFIIAYALVLAIVLFADRRPSSSSQDRYSHVIDLTAAQVSKSQTDASKTRIIAPGSLIPGTWTAGEIPSERLVAPLIVLDLDTAANNQTPQISLDHIARWEAQHGMIPQGAVVAIRRKPSAADRTADRTKDSASTSARPFPISRDAAMFLIEARYTIGFAAETPIDFSSDRPLSQQLALHGDYVVENAASFTSLPDLGSLIIVAPAKDKRPGAAPVRVLAMVK
jgi:kynurenine formamidase